MAETTTATAVAPTHAPKDYLGKAESALSDMDQGTLEESGPDLLDQEFELEDDLGEAPAPEGEDDGIDADLPSGEPVEGSAQKPFTVKTLPDAHITIKVDGEERTVPLREMVDGYMREGTFHKRVNEVNELKKQATDLANGLKEERTRIQTSFRELVSSPEEMYGFLEDHAEETLDQIARKRLKQMVHWQQNPAAKLAYDRERHETKLEKQRRALNEEQTTYRTERAQREATERYRATFEPGFKQGMKDAGYPTMNDELRTLIGGIINARRTQLNGAELTSKDIRDAVVRAARIAKTETVQDRKPLPPKPQPVIAKPRQASNGQRGQQQAQPRAFRDIFRNLGK